MAVFDLHLHTEWSYDAYSKVEDYFRFARQKNVRAIAVTDHHLMDGYEDVLDCAAKYPEIGYFAGSEITVSCKFGSFDLVCLGLPSRPTAESEELFDVYRRWQVEYGTDISRNLCGQGFDFDDDIRMELLKSYRAERIISRQGNTHVKPQLLYQYCLDHGFCKDRESYLKIREKFTGMTPYPSCEKVIPLIKKAGGKIFIAHPKNYFRINDLERMDMLREMFQLDGIECAHPSVPAELSVFYREYCKRHKLLSSGGSDIHDAIFDEFAVHDGKDEWLDEIIEQIKLYHGV